MLRALLFAALAIGFSADGASARSALQTYGAYVNVIVRHVDAPIKLAQGGMMPGPGTVHSTGGGSPASFTFGANQGSSGAQATSPFSRSGTFNSGAADIPVVGVTQPNDFGSGTMTAITITGPASTTCIQGVNNASEQAWLCYGTAGTLTTANVNITFTGTIVAYMATGMVTSTTATPYSTGLSTAGQGGGVAVPFTALATTGSGGIPTNGVGVCVIGDFFASTRTFTATANIPSGQITNDGASGNGQNFAMGSNTTAGASNGVTVGGTASIFPAWACVSWSP